MGLMLRINIPKRGQKVTNGDVIKALFPDTEIITQYDNPFGGTFMVFTLNNETMQISLKWWNASYKAGDTE